MRKMNKVGHYWEITKMKERKNTPFSVSRMSEAAVPVLSPCRQPTKGGKAGRWRETR